MRIKAGTFIRQRFLWLPVVLVALAGLWLAPSAIAAGEPAFGCGHVHTAEAQRNPYGPNDGPPPIAIGDSTMLLPIPDLTRVGFDVNAKGCRGFKQSVWVARDLRNQDKLPKMILINAYGNGGVNDDLIKFALKVIGPKRTLVLVTAYDADTGHPPAPDTDVLVRAAKDHPDQIKLLDWVKYSLPHHKVEPAPGAWFLPDLFHPNFTGAPAYANFLAQVLPGGAPSEPKEGSDDGGGTPWWPFALGAAAILLAALFLIRRRVNS
jgi:MYXO-CTERM domain-containing protein